MYEGFVGFQHCLLLVLFDFHDFYFVGKVVFEHMGHSLSEE